MTQPRLRRSRRRSRYGHRRPEREASAPPPADIIDESLWQTLRAVVVSPRPAMVRLVDDSRAGRKGLVLLLLVGVAFMLDVVVRGGFDPMTSLLASLGAVVAVALGAVVVHRVSRSGSYESAFGRLSFAYAVPAAVALLLTAALSVVLLLLGSAADAEPFGTLNTLVSLGSLIWTVALAYLAIRAGVPEHERVGCTTALVVAVLLIVPLVLLIPFIIADVGTP